MNFDLRKVCTLLSYLKKNPDLAFSMIFALGAAFAAPFSAEAMIKSVNLPLLLLLFCLMAIVAGLRESGVFTYGFVCLMKRGPSSRMLARLFIFCCFFSSMLITNDVALIIFVPLAILTLTKAKLTELMVPVVTGETIAANMGSMLTPIGNPQNLFIYSHYGLSLMEFVSVTGPVVLASGIILWMSTIRIADEECTVDTEELPELPKKRICILLGLFVVCLLYVLRVLPVESLAAAAAVLFFLDRRLLLAVDFKLLLLFTFLFLGVGCLVRVPALADAPARLLSGHEFFASLLLSQIVSNVPTTVMLAPYTEAADELLLGVNIGGLGTIIASMASVISFKAYIDTRPDRMKAYLVFFTAANLLLLAVLLLGVWILGWI